MKPQSCTGAQGKIRSAVFTWPALQAPLSQARENVGGLELSEQDAQVSERSKDVNLNRFPVTPFP